MTRGRRHRRPAAPATLPDNDDILSEILLRLPPRPSSLPRASLVCKRWRRLVTDPHFRRRFRSRHPNPPLIGFFDEFVDFPFFRSVMDPPDLIPPKRFCPPIGDEKGGCDPNHWRNFGCRHGRVLLYSLKEKEIVVWDPPTGDHRRVAVPPELDNGERMIWNGAVLCAAASDHSHVHGGFCSCPFKVAVVGVTRNHTQVFACIYSSQTGKWSNLVSAAVPFVVYYVGRPGVLVGNALYWMPLGHDYGIAEFDLDKHTLALVECPSGAEVSKGGSRILLAQNGVLCLASLSGNSLQMWERKVCSEGVASWVLRKSDKLQKILGQSSSMAILGYADDINVMSLWIDGSCCFLQLNSLQFTKLWKTNIISKNHPYASIYDSGI
ncbi:F-box protein At5g03970-like [Miscanthus floridulus]|uniref:F-box protein At5g03970-like n=1 Tax=Miscanthus floridulus TaxID=154761 RepID=UPI0034598FA8